MMLWMILIGILILIYMVERLILIIDILIEGFNKILITIISKEPELTDDWAGK